MKLTNDQNKEFSICRVVSRLRAVLGHIGLFTRVNKAVVATIQETLEAVEDSSQQCKLSIGCGPSDYIMQPDHTSKKGSNHEESIMSIALAKCGMVPSCISSWPYVGSGLGPGPGSEARGRGLGPKARRLSRGPGPRPEAWSPEPLGSGPKPLALSLWVRTSSSWP